ncbi:hypothetical protein LPA44_02470 [Halobacterium sp. KA-4]|uniref:hypothetical protein n=1 Tax=Halobacterium sp. KA-4 TaxID=2896367 RepID=UPI001E50E9B5|nr:hypothetical protein [Halobacterium sp. KA-4]MCD2198765.1 hypothetical protein [Halobacterium sp. KA-4]
MATDSDQPLVRSWSRYDVVLAGIPLAFAVAFVFGAAVSASHVERAAFGAAGAVPMTAYALFFVPPEN